MASAADSPAKMMLADLAVIIPCFNCVATIDACVDSVWRQTLRPRRLILVDDCSMDKTLRRLQHLQDLHGSDWITVVPLAANQGPAAARNAGLSLAHEKFVAFLDADDLWWPEKVSLQYSWMESNSLAWLSAHPVVRPNVRAFDLSGNECITANKLTPLTMVFSNRIATTSVMMRNEGGDRFLTAKKYSEDYLLWMQILLSGRMCVLLSKPLAERYGASRFSESGLTGRRLQMSLGELDTFRRLRQGGTLSWPLFLLGILISVVKSCMRIVLGFLVQTYR